MTRAAAIIALCTAVAGPIAAEERGSAPRQLLQVPFVSQSERLCGGAAAAMLLRAAGERGVYAHEFAALVDEEAGGIRTMDLAAAISARGYTVHVAAGTPAAVQRQIAAGRPVLALVEDRPGRYHYVVVVAWADGMVVFHDPARAPFTSRPQAAFDRAWSATDRWMLVIGGRHERASIASVPAVPRQPAAAARATELFAEGKYQAAAREAERVLASDVGRADAWRLLGASRYLQNDFHGALDAWNHAAGPTIDLVRIEGVVRTPHRAVERLIDLAPGTALTRENLVRAERRLSLLPSQQGSRVSYVALPGNLAEVRGAIVERPLYPSRTEWLLEAARLPIDREVGASLSNVAASGDRLRFAWRFWEGRPRAAVSFAFPSARGGGGLWNLSSEWQQETYANAPRSGVREARIGWTNWTTARMRMSGATGVARWDTGITRAILDLAAEYRPLHDTLALGLSARGGAGTAAPFATVHGTIRWRHATDGGRLSGSASAARATSGTPLERWPGADTGTARPLLLRAHPLLEGGAIAGTVFGRTLAHATFEAERGVLTRGLAVIGLAVFADAARAWDGLGGGHSPLHVDTGIGLRVRVAPGEPALRVDVARGLRDGRMVVSAGWQVGWDAARSR